MKKLNSILFSLTIIVATTILLISCEREGISIAADSDWTTTEDAHFKFSIQYPKGWMFENNQSQSPKKIGRTLQFYNGDWKDEGPHSNAVTKIEVGAYFVEKNNEMDLEEWSKEYDANYNGLPANEITILSENSQTIDGIEYFMKSAISPMCNYSYVNVSRGNVVWFFWTNSTDEAVKNIVQHMATTIDFSEQSPRKLIELYGAKFQSMPLTINNIENESTISKRGAVTYKAPITAQNKTILCGGANAPICNGTHSGSAGKAIDVSIVSGTDIITAAYSIVQSAGWDNSGYGNLIKMRDVDNNIAYYAHLSSILWGTLYNDWWQPEWKNISTKIGESGNSGTVGYHLHFHVHTSSGEAYNLSGANGIDLWSDYPNCNRSACEINGSSWFQCNCGKINPVTNSTQSFFFGSSTTKYNVKFKSTDNRYLCSENGNAFAIANRTAIGDWEKFTLELASDGTFAIKGNNGKYADVDRGSQRRIKFNQTDKWNPDCRFKLENAGNGYYAIKSMAIDSGTGKYVASEGTYNVPVRADRSAIGHWEKWRLIE